MFIVYGLNYPLRSQKTLQLVGGLSVPMIHQAVLVELLMPGRLVMRFQTKKWLDSKSNPKGTPSWRTLRDSQLEDLLRALVHPI